MVETREYIAIIPARKGSKRLKNKNLIKIKKQRMFDYTMRAAINCKKISNPNASEKLYKLVSGVLSE